jgi:ankyrin repeat protein
LLELIEKIDSVVKENGEPSDEELKRIVQKALEASNRTLNELARRCLNLGDKDDITHIYRLTRPIYFTLSSKSIQRFEHELQINIASAQFAFSVLYLEERQDLIRQIKALRKTIEAAIEDTTRKPSPLDDILGRLDASPVAIKDLDICIEAKSITTTKSSTSAASHPVQQKEENDAYGSPLALLTSQEKHAWEALRTETLRLHDIEKTPNAADSMPLIEAIVQHSPAFQQLLDDDINMNGTDDRGYTPLMHTVSQHGKTCDECLQCMHKLLQLRVDMDATNNGDTALHLSVKGRHLVAAKALLEKGARIDTLSPNTPLMLAIKSNQPAFVDLFLSHRADITVVDDAKWGLLHHAVWRNCVESLLTLLEKTKAMNLNLDLDARCAVNWTALMHLAQNAQRSSNFRLAQILLDHGADVNVTDVCGYSALYYAITMGTGSSQRNNFIRLLLERGVNVEAVRSQVSKRALDRFPVLRRHPTT